MKLVFPKDDLMLPKRLGRNKTRDIDVDDDVERLSIFKPKGRPLHSRARMRYLQDDEIRAARTYVLLNCPEIEAHRKIFVAELRERNREISETEIERVLERDFASWFELHVKDPTVCTNRFIRSLAQGPFKPVITYKGYYVNDFKFHTQEYGKDKLAMKYGVCVRGSQYAEGENDIYGVLTDIIELEYPALPMKKTVLFKCEWFDFMDSGKNTSSRYNKYKPFILAEHADQVHSTMANKGVMLDKRAQDMTRLVAASQLPTGEGAFSSIGDVDETQLFPDTEGVNKKRRVNGIGLATSAYADTASSKARVRPITSQSQQVEEEIERRVQAGIKEGMRYFEERMTEKMDELFRVELEKIKSTLHSQLPTDRPVRL